MAYRPGDTLRSRGGDRVVPSLNSVKANLSPDLLTDPPARLIALAISTFATSWAPSPNWADTTFMTKSLTVPGSPVGRSPMNTAGSWIVRVFG
jgi:hypothetical protein